jgi:glycosyltransferase 2 family protein
MMREDQEGAEAQASTIRRQLVHPRTALSFILAGAIIVVFLRRSDVDPNEIWSNIRNANLLFLLLAFIVHYSSIVVRAVRWRWMLDVAGVGRTADAVLPGRAYLSGVLMISWMVNCIVPAKLGDAYRAYRIRRDDGIRYSFGFGTIFSERVFDLIVLMLLFVLSGVISFHGSLPGQSGSALIFGGILVGIVIVGLLVMYFARPLIVQMVPVRFQGHYTRFQDTLFLTLKRPALPVALAIVIWVFEGLRVMLVSEALGAHLGWETALFVALLSALLTTLPVTPAGLGVVEVATMTALTFVSVPSGMAGSVAVLDRVITYWCAILFGAIVALIMWKWSGRHPEMALSTKETVRSTS